MSSALEVIFYNEMRYINLSFTYFYLLTSFRRFISSRNIVVLARNFVWRGLRMEPPRSRRRDRDAKGVVGKDMRYGEAD